MTIMTIITVTHHFILVIHTGALLDQLLHDVHVALGGCPLQSRVPRLSIIMMITDDGGGDTDYVDGDDGGDGGGDDEQHSQNPAGTRHIRRV